MTLMNRATDPTPEQQTNAKATPTFARSVATLGWVFATVFLGFSGFKLSRSLSEYYKPDRIFAPLAANKIRFDGDRQYLWAKGPLDSPGDEADWFDLTGSPLPLDRFQFGIGRDTIRSIDNPIFVRPDDPRLRKMWGFDIDQLAVIGYEHNGIARAYPIELLDRHELVNDTVGGKPVTVGW